MKKLLLFSLIATLSFPLIAEDKEMEKDLNALKILVKNCAGCHNRENHPGSLFLNQSSLTEKETLSLMEKLIKTSKMPPEHAKFKETKDGKELLKWLSDRKKQLK